MRTYFADTGYLIGLLLPKDELHETAVSTSASLGKFKIVTSELVLVELLNDFAGRGSHLRRAAVSLGDKLQNSDSVELVGATSDLVQESLRLYRERPDKDWSLTDCSSFVLMKELDLTEALTYDSHFEQAGFRAVLRGDR